MSDIKEKITDEILRFMWSGYEVNGVPVQGNVHGYLVEELRGKFSGFPTQREDFFDFCEELGFSVSEALNERGQECRIIHV